MFDAGKKQNDWATVWWKIYDDMLSRFHTIPACHGRTDKRTDGRTDRIAVSISRVSVLTRDKNDFWFDLNHFSGNDFDLIQINFFVILSRDIDIARCQERVCKQLKYLNSYAIYQLVPFLMTLNEP